MIIEGQQQTTQAELMASARFKMLLVTSLGIESMYRGRVYLDDKVTGGIPCHLGEL